MTSIFATKALTARGWAEDVRITIDGGLIADVQPESRPNAADQQVAIVIPGLSNAHSHAFQRVLAGHTEQRGPAGKDNFWTWRSRMYALAGRIDSAALKIIARQVYGEMVATGYTSVAEFHYLHNEQGESAPSEKMFAAIAAAAEESGIRLTYVPVLYERAGFDQPEPSPEQQQFAREAAEFIDHYRAIAANATGRIGTGIGVHSLRAVSAESLRLVADVAKADGVPMHIHIAEQQREVEDCIDILGARPVEWLLDNCAVDENWCLVHATHVDPGELTAIRQAGAVVCLCPSTEANLGDGLFPLQSFLEQGGRIAIGSDSHVSINPFEELRWLEYGQRLISQQRNIAAIRRPETGRSLFELATAGGAAACGNGSGEIAKGANADLVVLDDDSPMLAGHTTKSLLDALVFSGFSLPIDRVMVAGDWQVIDGRHQSLEQNREDYAEVARQLQLEDAGQ